MALLARSFITFIILFVCTLAFLLVQEPISTSKNGINSSIDQISRPNNGTFVSPNHPTTDYQVISTEHNRPLCSREQLRSGRWVRQTPSTIPYDYPREHKQCMSITRDSEELSSYRSYQWQPDDSSCELSNWNQTDFCRLVKHGTVLIVGDSLSFEMFESLLLLNGRESVFGTISLSRRDQRTVVMNVCDHMQTHVAYRRADHLENLNQLIEETFPTVLVLNRGAHYVPDDELISDMQDTIAAIQSWQTRCQALGIYCQLFWRTTVPGHPECAEFTRPVNNLTRMEKLVRRSLSHSTRTYNWNQFKQQNQLVLRLLKESKVDHHVIDAYEINILRPDQHVDPNRDCLHNCLPGKVDVYNQLLLHFLKGLVKPEHIERLGAIDDYPTKVVENVRVRWDDMGRYHNRWIPSPSAG
jgi:hypothetical protein